MNSEIQRLTEERDALLRLLAEWACAVESNGSDWDSWDYHYKRVMWDAEPRELLDQAINAVRQRREADIARREAERKYYEEEGK